MRWVCLSILWLGPLSGCFYDWDELTPTSVCAGQWSAPEPVLHAPFNMSTVAVGPGGLELFVLRDDGATALEFWQLRRGSLAEPFIEGVPATGLTAACADTPGPLGIDIGADGTRAYVTCQGPNPLEPGPVKVVSRSSRNAPFDEPGVVAGDAWSGARLSGDELRLYTSGHPTGSAPFEASRGDTNGTFGDPSIVPGLDSIPLKAPAPASDTLTLFGTLTEPTTQLGFVTRADGEGPFGSFAALYTGLAAAGAPVVQPDCRVLYFLASGTSDESSVHSCDVYALRRSD